MHSKKLYFGTNTKMSMTDSEAVAFLTELADCTGRFANENVQLFVIPSFTVLHRAREILKDTKVLLGAQNMCWEERGQFTGEISPLSLVENGVRIAEIGHSERRHVFGESDFDESRKVKAACEHGLTALLCIGETAQQKEVGISDEILSMQIKIGLHESDKACCAKRLWVAYEPVWAIGVNGTPAAPEYVCARHHTIRGVLQSIFGETAGQEIPIFYGGSVNKGNATEIIQMPDVDGLFVGRAAWQAQNYADMVQAVLPLFSAKK